MQINLHIYCKMIWGQILWTQASRYTSPSISRSEIYPKASVLLNHRKHVFTRDRPESSCRSIRFNLCSWTFLEWCTLNKTRINFCFVCIFILFCITFCWDRTHRYLMHLLSLQFSWIFIDYSYTYIISFSMPLVSVFK